MSLGDMFGKGRVDKSNISRFEKGYFPCSKCGKKLSIYNYEPLNMMHCPKCNDLNLVPLKISEWWVYKPLGGGGMGSVYEARHNLDHSIKGAVKILLSEDSNKTHIQDLLLEGKVGYSFGEHENLAQVYSYGKQYDTTYLIMEMVEGIRLDQFIENNTEVQKSENGQVVSLSFFLSPELALYYSFDILKALQHMYCCGYLYRDLKPENILINTDDCAVLVDYGLCMELMDAWLYDGDEILGSPLYMPPERIKGEGKIFELICIP